MTVKQIYIFKGFERFWHWAQAVLIMFMALTGFEIDGTYTDPAQRLLAATLRRLSWQSTRVMNQIPLHFHRFEIWF